MSESSPSARRGYARRRGYVHHVDIDELPQDLRVPEGVTDVLVIVHHDGAVVGQAWLRPVGRLVVAEDQRGALVGVAGRIVERRQVRRLVEAALDHPRPETGRAERSVSVVVCTRDRADQLLSCLRSLQALRRPGLEVLVVDNGSRSPATRELCASLGVRCVVEPLAGQTRARNFGIAETTGELVAFTDDDVVVDAAWLDGLDDVFDDPSVMVATGYIGPLELEHSSQVHFEAHGGFERHGDRFVLDPAQVSPMAGAAVAGAGANMVIRRAVFASIGNFDVDFGPGTPTRTSDDKLFFYRVLEAGHRIEYDPRRQVWHQHRREPQALRRIMRDYGTGEFAWTGHVLRSRRDLGALRVWRWWGLHYVQDLRRLAHGSQTAVPPWVTREEIAGVLKAPAALRTVNGGVFGPARGPMVPGATTSAFAPVGDARVVAEAAEVSVALASYNRRERLRGVLERLADQELAAERFEVVVVLDGSTDGSGEMIRGLDMPYTIRLIEQHNRGLAASRNVGARTARHPLVVFLDDDIEPRPEWVGEHAAAHAATSQDTFVMGYFPPILGGSWLEQDLRRWWLDHFRRKGQPGHRWTLNDVVDGNSSMPVRLLERVGWFDEDFTGGRRHDYELAVRLLAARIPLAYHARARGDHHPATGIVTTLRNARAEGRYDALLVTKHPHVVSQLPLGRPDRGRRATGRTLLAGSLGVDGCMAVAAWLEALGRREWWRSFLGHARDAQYHAGSCEGFADLGRAAPPATTNGRCCVDVPIDPGSGPLQLDDAGSADLVPTLRGRPLGRVRAVAPGSQWDWEDVVERLTDAVLTAGTLGSGAAPR
jgi:glycosyltransferase involved in cell wall biosynthesis